LPAKTFEEPRPMTFVTIAVTAFVLVYLVTALIRPEWF
jgi:K+-transporting ATPase KdpF subunit